MPSEYQDGTADPCQGMGWAWVWMCSVLAIAFCLAMALKWLCLYQKVGGKGQGQRLIARFGKSSTLPVARRELAASA
jgi:hypothetical protein